jgi:malonate-semialdehyde dehydrogenase (acetylating)/methylmalonate-semialdehyde dehydrogenase
MILTHRESNRKGGTPMAAEIATVTNYLNGRFVSPGNADYIPVMNPGLGRQIARVPLSTAEHVDAAVTSARAALPGWSGMPIKERAQVLYRYRGLLIKDARELADLVHEENGKTHGEALAEVEKPVEVAEFACSMPQLAVGEILEASRGVECRIERYPVGVVASITPFNFPNMVPNWTIPNALVLGNT